MIKLIDILLENDEDVKYPKGKYVEITNKVELEAKIEALQTEVEALKAN